MTKNNYLSRIKYYWYGYTGLIFILFFVNFLIVREFKNFSFELFFLFVIPVWFGTLFINNIETERIKSFFEKYLEANYPDLLNTYNNKPVDVLLADSEQILDLLNHEALIKDEQVIFLKKEAKGVTNFLVTVFLSVPAAFFISVFLLLRW